MFQPFPPDAPLTYDEPEQAAVADARQDARVKKLAASRSSDTSASWRGVLLGKLQHRQDRLLSAMSDAGLPDHVIERTANCAKHAFVFRNNNNGRLRIRHYTCHNRFCLMCQRSYLRQVRETALNLLPNPTHRLSFLTLTQPARPGVDITAAIDSIVGRFRQIRRTYAWKERVSGGIYVVDITRSFHGWWHVHLHVIIDSDFWPLDELDALCVSHTRRPLHSHIKGIDGDRRKSMNQYLSKYLSKPFDDSLYDHPECLTAFIRATRNRRLLQAFGTWQPSRVTRKATRKLRQLTDADQWTFTGEIHDLLNDAESGSIRAAKILRQLGFSAIHLRVDAVSELDRYEQSRAPPPEQALQLWTQYA